MGVSCPNSGLRRTENAKNRKKTVVVKEQLMSYDILQNFQTLVEKLLVVKPGTCTLKRSPTLKETEGRSQVVLHLLIRKLRHLRFKLKLPIKLEGFVRGDPGHFPE